MFGTTREGHSICCSASTYIPYFYAEAPANYKSEDQLAGYVTGMNDQMKNLAPQLRSFIPANVTQIVTGIEEVRGANLMHYTEDMNRLFLKISLISPKLINQCMSFYSLQSV
jgi:DNA polymerase delta subunit 1